MNTGQEIHADTPSPSNPPRIDAANNIATMDNIPSKDLNVRQEASQARRCRTDNGKPLSSGAFQATRFTFIRDRSTAFTSVQYHNIPNRRAFQ
ncbi:hypothetical protein FEM03_23050 [Phragmitibacter flavus]|uniref:Uncharacterized protein n=1 Tax=Phragmitibacter flavus TaxID=2576071 RepID=A0A5R8K7P8_9BACT|nr:hypothetical protein FEM03_23050 [Phragmitibacter flavus]